VDITEVKTVKETFLQYFASFANEISIVIPFRLPFVQGNFLLFHERKKLSNFSTFCKKKRKEKKTFCPIEFDFTTMRNHLENDLISLSFLSPFLSRRNIEE
jgi:hypothetical protein